MAIAKKKVGSKVVSFSKELKSQVTALIEKAQKGTDKRIVSLEKEIERLKAGQQKSAAKAEKTASVKMKVKKSKSAKAKKG